MRVISMPLITATRSRLRLHRTAAIKFGSRPEANVLVPAWSSTYAFVLMQCTIVFASGNPRRSGGGPDDPVRIDICFMQSLIDARLVRSKRATTLKHQHYLAG